MPDFRRSEKNAEKKTISISSATIKAADVSNTDNCLMFELPDNALIVASHTITKVAGQTGLTVDFGFDGGNELGNDLDIDNTGVLGGELTTAIDTGTGKTVTAKFSAAPTAGEFVFIVEYIEYTLGNGMRTNYV